MKLGLGSFTFTWAIGVPGHPPAEPLTAAELVRIAGRLGVRVVQICDNLPLDTYSDDELGALECVAREASVAVEVGTRGIDDARLVRYLELARRFQSPIVRLVVDCGGDEPSPARVIQRLSVHRDAFRTAGVRLAIENHDRFSAKTLAGLVRELGTDWAGVCLDTVNSFGALEGPEFVVDCLAPLALSLHVKDFTISRPNHQMGFRVEGCAAGAGRLDLRSILERLRSEGRDVNAILETWVTPGQTLMETIECERAWTEQGVKYCRGLISDETP